MKLLLVAGLLGANFGVQVQAQGQREAPLFHWPYSYQITVPRAVFLQIKERVQVAEHWGVVPERFTVLPVFNVLHPKQRAFTDGLYYNICSVHDTGRLFIYRKKRIIFLRNNSLQAMLADYVNFLRSNALAPATQLECLQAISAFIKFQQEE